MNRTKKIKSFIDTNRLGLEIGPSHAPICPKADGYKVEIIDHMNQGDLRKKYEAHGVDLSAIEPVDYVWHGESYRELTGRTHEYGWAIASHVIEHTPDMIRFLQGCDEVLAPDGVLSLAVPDKRFCFDHLRPKSSLAAVIDAYEARRNIHSPGTAADYFLNVCAATSGDWPDSTAETLKFIHTIDDAISAMEASRSGAFLDLHSWCFTPSSFRLVVYDLYDLGLIKLREAGFFETKGNEFFIALSRNGKGPSLSRLELASLSRREEAIEAASVRRMGRSFGKFLFNVLSGRNRRRALDGSPNGAGARQA
jgi:2-polyprenyl-3-methyl-5-hydroxy-6-metoxy-1,4-benzoquinol methylase